MTKFERLIAAYLGADFKQMPAEELQIRLDEIAHDVLWDFDTYDMGQHMAAVYNATAKDYAHGSHTQGVIEELITFMNMDTLPEGGFVLDVGCGPGRDALFMVCPDPVFRSANMQRVKNGKRVIDMFEVTKKTLCVIGIDISLQMLLYAQQELYMLAKERKPIVHMPLFLLDDMHQLQIHKAVGPEFFDGIWSCAGLFTHSLHVKPTLFNQIAFLLKKGGIFFTSYTNSGMTGQWRDRLLVSSTGGHIKYFSECDPKTVAYMADGAGLSLIAESYSDSKRPNESVKKRLFVSQFYRKR